MIILHDAILTELASTLWFKAKSCD